MDSPCPSCPAGVVGGIPGGEGQKEAGQGRPGGQEAGQGAAGSGGEDGRSLQEAEQEYCSQARVLGHTPPGPRPRPPVETGLGSPDLDCKPLRPPLEAAAAAWLCSAPLPGCTPGAPRCPRYSSAGQEPWPQSWPLFSATSGQSWERGSLAEEAP